jgi:WD40 repeat protein
MMTTTTIVIWSFTHHRDKVQSVEWHPTEGTLLATGSYDKTVSLVDAGYSMQKFKRVKISADCESIQWDPFHSQYLTVATEDGTISCWDVRKFEVLRLCGRSSQTNLVESAIFLTISEFTFSWLNNFVFAADEIVVRPSNAQENSGNACNLCSRQDGNTLGYVFI